MKYSLVVAVYDRPEELEELLESCTRQTFRDFEIVVVEDGSSRPSNHVCDRFADRLTIQYYVKSNSGPGPSRNYGCRRAVGDYFLFIDSDCMLPDDYLRHVDESVVANQWDAFGGPDREHASFTPIQKAISTTMTSFLTTGGIRGGRVRTGGAFHPRSFNMGISRDVFNATDGFARMRFGEDVEFSIRMIALGFRVGLIPDAWVYHKRRTDFRKFFKQVYNSGLARINITMRHPGTLKLTHFLPAAFTVGLAVAVLYVMLTLALPTLVVADLLARLGLPLAKPQPWYALVPFGLYLGVIAIEGAARNRSPLVGLLAAVAAMVQLVGYGSGFIVALVRRYVLGRPEQNAFEETFYD